MLLGLPRLTTQESKSRRRSGKIDKSYPFGTRVSGPLTDTTRGHVAGGDPPPVAGFVTDSVSLQPHGVCFVFHRR